MPWGHVMSAALTRWPRTHACLGHPAHGPCGWLLTGPAGGPSCVAGAPVMGPWARLVEPTAPPPRAQLLPHAGPRAGARSQPRVRPVPFVLRPMGVKPLPAGPGALAAPRVSVCPGEPAGLTHPQGRPRNARCCLRFARGRRSSPETSDVVLRGVPVCRVRWLPPRNAPHPGERGPPPAGPDRGGRGPARPRRVGLGGSGRRAFRSGRNL